MKEKTYNNAPLSIQNIMVALFDSLIYRKCYGGAYKSYRALFYKIGVYLGKRLKTYKKSGMKVLLTIQN